MNKALILAAAPLALTACATGSLETGVVPAGSFTALETPDRVYSSTQAVMQHYLAAVGRDVPTREETGDYPGGSGDRLLLFTAEHLEDDSVSAMQWRVLLDQTDGGLRVINAGVRQQCARSGSNDWTNSPCP